MKKLWKILIPTFVLCLCILLLPTKASAASESDLTFELNGYGNGYDVSDCIESASGELAIPATHNGKPVTGIGREAFSNCSSLTSITIPNGVTSIGNSAFYKCSKLTSVAIPDSVTIIDNNAFSNCISLTSATIGAGVTSIGNNAFYNCGSLTSVTIPNGVTSIGNSAFSNCKKLTRITIPDGVISIGDQAFSDCSKLTSVTIGNSVTIIGGAAFYNCSSLTSVTIPDGVISIGVKAFSNCSKLASVTIGNSVTSIGDKAFYYCSKLTSVTIGSSVTNIGDSAFLNCNSLTDIYITDVAAWLDISFGDYYSNPLCAGDPNKNLYLNGKLITDLILPDEVTAIPEYAFYQCTSIQSVTIPNCVTSIDNFAFNYCSSLTGIWVDDNNPNYSSDTYGILFDKDKTELICAPEAIVECVIPDGVTSIGNSAFSNCKKLTSITIPDSVTNIGNSAFYNCSSLTSVAIGAGVTSIGNNAFYNCGSLTSVTIGAGVTSIGDNAFYNCSSLTSITIPDSVTSIGRDAFYGCSSLTSITIPNGVTSIGSSAFSNCKKLTSITIPDSVTSIGYRAFYNCGSLTSITISDSVTSIGDEAFYNCSKLQYNTYDNAKYLGNKNNPYVVLVNTTYTSITTCEIHPSTKVIYYQAFYKCIWLTSITIPDSVTNIGNSAFYNCSSLKDVYYLGTQEQWDSILIDFYNTTLTNATMHFHTHSYDTCVVDVQPTFTSKGSQTKTCSCGESIVESIPQLVGKVKEWNVALGDDLTVNFYLEISDSIVSTAKVQLIQESNIQTAKISNLEKTEDGLYKISVHMAATQMNDTITVMVKNGSDKAPSADYSIRQYCDTLLADESQTAYHTLIKEMLNYGAAAQAYFAYESDGVANEGITGAGQTAVPERAPEMSVTGKAGNVRFYGASLVYESKIAVRFYFSGDVSGCTFTVGNQTYTPVAKNGLYYIEVNDILPQNLDETIAVTVASGENTLTVSYSPLNYIVRMNAKGTETLQALMRALYNYHLAAKALNDL